jgi:hypothetical protein
LRNIYVTSEFLSFKQLFSRVRAEQTPTPNAKRQEDTADLK